MSTDIDRLYPSRRPPQALKINSITSAMALERYSAGRRTRLWLPDYFRDEPAAGQCQLGYGAPRAVGRPRLVEPPVHGAGRFRASSSRCAVTERPRSDIAVQSLMRPPKGSTRIHHRYNQLTGDGNGHTQSNRA